MRDKVYKYLKFIRFKDVIQWDLKRYLNNSIKSKYEVVALNKLINEESKKYDISDKKSHYGILGVNNQTGVFDAYIESGAKIKQKYKKMDTGWIAYNPYRVNVGSIGIKRSEHKYDYISPAYVVFSCKPSILPEYLYMTMKTPSFNKIIRDNTTGSVRQNLSFDVLKGLNVPLPSIEVQKAIVHAYNDRLSKAKRLEQNVKEVENSIEDYLLSELGIQPQGYQITESELPMASEPQVEFVINRKQNADLTDTYVWGDEIKKEYKYLKFVRFKDIERWDCYNGEPNVLKRLKQSHYPLVEIGNKYDFIKRNWDKKEDTFRYVEIGAVDSFNGITNAEKMQTSKAPSRATQTIATGDLIIGTTRPYLKKFAIVDDKYNNCVCSSGFQVIAPDKEYNISFLYEYLKSSVAVAQFALFMTGALYPAITSKDLRKVLIPLPSLEVQNKIVEHINKRKSQIKELRQQAETLRNEALEAFEKEIFE